MQEIVQAEAKTAKTLAGIMDLCGQRRIDAERLLELTSYADVVHGSVTPRELRTCRSLERGFVATPCWLKWPASLTNQSFKAYALRE